MKIREFKSFKNIIATCDSDDLIWSAGYLWMNLTTSQYNEVYKILSKRDDCEKKVSKIGEFGVTIEGINGVTTPNGVFTLYESEVR